MPPPGPKGLPGPPGPPGPPLPGGLFNGLMSSGSSGNRSFVPSGRPHIGWPFGPRGPPMGPIEGSNPPCGGNGPKPPPSPPPRPPPGIGPPSGWRPPGGNGPSPPPGAGGLRFGFGTPPVTIPALGPIKLPDVPPPPPNNTDKINGGDINQLLSSVSKFLPPQRAPPPPPRRTPRSSARARPPPPRCRPHRPGVTLTLQLTSPQASPH